MSQPESRLQKRIREALEMNYPGSWWVKIHGGPYQKAGIPDLLGCIEGIFFGFEVKMPGEKPTALQSKTMESIRRAGGGSIAVTSPEEALDHVADLFARLDLLYREDPLVAEHAAMQRRLRIMARR